MKNFTDADLVTHGSKEPYTRIYADQSDLVYTTGYGSRLNSGQKISFNGRLYRIYTTIYSNAGSSWFKTKGRTIYVS